VVVTISMLGFGLENEELKLMKQEKEERKGHWDSTTVVKEEKTVAENVNF
jgi:hypothetical protein